MDGTDQPWGDVLDTIGRTRSGPPPSGRGIGRGIPVEAQSRAIAAIGLALPPREGMRGLLRAGPGQSGKEVPSKDGSTAHTADLSVGLFSARRRPLLMPASQAHRWRLLAKSRTAVPGAGLIAWASAVGSQLQAREHTVAASDNLAEALRHYC